MRNLLDLDGETPAKGGTKDGAHAIGTGATMTGATMGGAGGYNGDGSQQGANGTTGASHPGTTAGKHMLAGPH